MSIEQEFAKMCKRAQIKDLNLVFDRQIIKTFKASGLYFSGWGVVLPDRKLCRERIIVMLHELGHAIQFNENRLNDDKRRVRETLDNELDAECFAYHNYKKYYEKKFGDWSKRKKKLDLVAYIKRRRKVKT